MAVTELDKQRILDISGFNDLWGQDFDRAYVGIKGLNVTKEEISTKGIIIKTVIYLFLPKIQPDQLLFVFEFDYLQTFRAFVLE